MENDNKTSERQIAEITELCQNIFGKSTDLAVTRRGDCFDICFSYVDFGVKVSKEHEIRYGYYYFDIDVMFKNVLLAEPTPFWQLYAYYDDEKYDMNYRKDRFENYLTKLKEYLDGNRFFYAATDIEHRKRYFVLEGQRIDLPYNINLETENEQRFGEKSDRIVRYRPIYEGNRI